MALKRWWEEVERSGGPTTKFRLERSFNRATRSFGFYGEVPLDDGTMPVMGNVQEMFYDQVRGPAHQFADSAEWMAEQIREYALRYFMRTSSFRQPEAYVDFSHPLPPPSLTRLSWCPAPQSANSGFGFTQLFNKRVDSGEVHAFPGYEQSAIVDQRQLGKLYEWILLKVRIFDFNFRTRPFGVNGPELVFGLNEESYLVAHSAFVTDKRDPYPTALADYGVGYCFVKSPTPSALGYGPGEFDAAIELINFRVYKTGYVSVRMIFIANRPKSIANVAIDPVDWGFRLADLFSLGIASRVLAPARELAGRLPLRLSIDPVTSYVTAANALSGNYASEALCISMEQLEKLFLLQHFQQHYQTILGSLETWRRMPDWLDEKSLPPWVVSGAGS
ncbi:MAG TPA: hypothetical protein VK789_17475 [Bryobacteraceae bacterium]|nr:hypothetical protein [Bryobacteraceae bacterium]